MKKATTKRALLASVVSLLLCMSMLIGSTFAWFTDTDTTAVSSIVSGTLELEIQDADGNEKTDALKFLAADNRTDILWEPGTTYKTEQFQLVNVGNLWLKYKVEINGIQVSDNKLNEVIKFYLVDAEGNKTLLNDLKMADLPLGPTSGTGLMYIEGHMDENAGNEYQNLTLSGVSITVHAAQYTEETDMTDDQYDAKAQYAVVDTWDGTKDDAGLGDNTTPDTKVITIESAEQLAAFAASVNAGTAYHNYTIDLTTDIDLTGHAWTPIYAWNGLLDGTTINGNGHAIKNMSVEGGASAGFISSNASRLTIKDLTFEGAVVKPNSGNSTHSGVVIGKDYSSAVLENVKVKNSQVISNWQCGGLVGFAETNATVFNNCSISDSFLGGYNCTAGAFFGLGGVDITVNGGSATNVQLYTDGLTWDSTQKPGGEKFLVGHLYGRTLTVNGCTVSNVTVVSEYPAN